MTAQAKQVRQLISRSKATLFTSLVAELSRAIVCCRIAKTASDAGTSLQYVLVAEATSAKFLKLCSQGKVIESKTLLQLVSLLEQELGGRLSIGFSPKIPQVPIHVRELVQSRAALQAGRFPFTGR